MARLEWDAECVHCTNPGSSYDPEWDVWECHGHRGAFAQDQRDAFDAAFYAAVYADALEHLAQHDLSA